MFNLGDDNELDRMSREAAGKFMPPGEANWDLLSEQLDKVLPVEKKKRRIAFYWWLLPALLVGGAAAYLLVGDQKNTTATETAIRQTDKKETKPSVANVPAVPQNDIKKEATTGTIAPIVEAKPADKPAEKSVEKNNNIAVNRNVPFKPVQENEANAKSAKQKERNSVDKTIASTASATRPQTDAVVPAKPQAVNNATQPVVNATVQADNNVTANSNNTVSNQTTEPVKTAAASDDKSNQLQAAATPGQTSQLTETAEKKVTVTSLKRGKGWSFGLLAGIDKSTVKFKYAEDAGLNIGLIAGYHLSDRWSLHTGAIYTQKNYKVDGPDFTAQKGTWPSYYKLETVEGYCRMWEVPLIARYRFSQGPKSSFFFGMGLSSYFMTKENYDYTYYNNSGSLTTRNAAYNSTDTHVLSILHLSTGFEKGIGGNWSMLIEPYAKLPLGGVGQGNIRLSSFGLNFSLQHRQPGNK